MVKCLTLSFVLSGVVLAGLGYILYTPLPPHLANWWNVQIFNVKFKSSVMFSMLKSTVGIIDQMAALRSAFIDHTHTPLTEDDIRMLEIYDKQIDGVPVRVYKPKSATGLLPGLVYFHGGGGVVLSVAVYDGICAYIARTSNIIVISVEYRLAPEFPFPAGFNDCLLVTLNVLKDGGKIGLDPSRIAVGGDSGGGNLAAAVSLRLRNDKVKPPLKAQLVIYGILQLCDMTLPSYRMRQAYDPDEVKNVVSFFSLYLNLTESQQKLMVERKHLTQEVQRKCDKFVDYELLPKDILPDHHIRSDRLATSVTDDIRYINSILDDPRAAPMMSEDLTNMPASFILSVYWDNVRDENLIYAEKLKTAGNKVRILYLPDSFHGIFNCFHRSGFDAPGKIMNEILSFLKENLV